MNVSKIPRNRAIMVIVRDDADDEEVALLQLFIQQMVGVVTTTEVPLGPDGARAVLANRYKLRSELLAILAKSK